MKLSNVFKDIKDNREVYKLVFEGTKKITETVLYKYKDRISVCFSSQSGCPVGCVFCGTGKKFIGNLTSEEMINQIETSLDVVRPIKANTRIQLMPMSMGEPMLNFCEVKKVAEYYLDNLDQNMYFFMSTVGVDNIVQYQIKDLYCFDNFGLQFSLHNPFDEERKKILGNFKQLLPIKNLRMIADDFKEISGKMAYFNFVVTEEDYSQLYLQEIVNIVGDHHLTISVLCDKNSFSQGDVSKAFKFANELNKIKSIDYSIFNPIGQDTIGGGCGQLLYVQKKLKESKNE